jgi:hypothetical protein
MLAMFAEPSSDPLPYRITLFFGPEQVEGKPCTQACVFNVKKRSWKGGIQVVIEVTEWQIETSSALIEFPRWIARAQHHVPPEERDRLAARAHELLVQAICWCKLDLLLHAGILQENQRLDASSLVYELTEVVPRRTGFILSYVAGELDIQPPEIALS